MLHVAMKIAFTLSTVYGTPINEYAVEMAETFQMQCEDTIQSPTSIQSSCSSCAVPTSGSLEPWTWEAIGQEVETKLGVGLDG